MRFAEIYNQGRPIFSLEFFPPRDPALLDNTLSLIKSLHALGPDFMTCTYGAGGGTRALTRQIVSYMQNQLGATSVAHLTCVGHSVAELSTVLDQLNAEGVQHVLALRGDPPKGTAAFEAHPEGLKNARELVELITERQDFSIAVAGYPEGHREARSPQSELEYLRSKVDAGAEVIFTQLFFDVDSFFRFVDNARRAGVSVPIVPGLMPLSSVSQLARFEELFNVQVPSVAAPILQTLKASY